MGVRHETVKFVGGSHHEKEHSIEKGVRQVRMPRHWRDPPPVSDPPEIYHPELYERVVKHDGTVFMVYRPGR